MKLLIQFGLAVFILSSVICCKDKTEALPVANFSWSKTSFHEGDTLQFINSSSNASSVLWTSTYRNWSSTEYSPQLVIDSAGQYTFTLKTTNGDGKTNSKSLDITVLPDTIFRLSNNSKKVWIVQSIMYNGSEMLNENCQKDDEFIVFRNGIKDTCNITEGKETCPDGTYIFELPASSDWRYDSKSKSFDFALTAFGTPINLNFSAQKCTRDTFEGTDAINGVSIRLIKKK